MGSAADIVMYSGSMNRLELPTSPHWSSESGTGVNAKVSSPRTYDSRNYGKCDAREMT